MCFFKTKLFITYILLGAQVVMKKRGQWAIGCGFAHRPGGDFVDGAVCVFPRGNSLLPLPMMSRARVHCPFRGSVPSACPSVRSFLR